MTFLCPFWSFTEHDMQIGQIITTKNKTDEHNAINSSTSFYKTNIYKNSKLQELVDS